MANEKISQLPAGAPAQTTDQVPIARSGSNFFLTVADIIAKFAAAFGFNAITSGVNTAQTLTVGNGSTLAPSGTGVVNANEVAGVTVSGTPAAGSVLQATSTSAASWAAGLVLPSSGLRIQFGTATGSGTNQPFSFPIAFSGAPVVVLGNQTGSADIHTGSISTSGFALDFSSGSQSVCWIAIGPA